MHWIRVENKGIKEESRIVGLTTGKMWLPLAEMGKTLCGFGVGPRVWLQT